MARKVLTSLDLNWLVLKGLRLENFSTTNIETALAYDGSGANEGRIAYDSTEHKIKYRNNERTEIKTVATEQWADDKFIPNISLADWAKANTKPMYNASEIKLSSSYSKAATGSTNFTANSTTIEDAIAKLAKAVDGKTSNVGTVTSVGVSLPTGLTASGSPVTGSGTIAISYATGYSIPTTALQGDWNNAAATVASGMDDWNNAYDWVAENADDIVLGLVVGCSNEWPTRAIVTQKPSLDSSHQVVGVTIHRDSTTGVLKLCVVISEVGLSSKGHSYYSNWDAIGNVKADTYYNRVGMCVVVGKDIYRYNGTTWELKYSGVDTDIVGRVETLEAYFDNQDDADKFINKWHELVKFLESYEESDTLAKLLEKKANSATTLAGYGITDAKIANGTITLGGNTITPIEKPTTAGTSGQVLGTNGEGNVVWVTKKVVSNKAFTASNTATFWSFSINDLGTNDVVVKVYENKNGSLEEVIADVTVLVSDTSYTVRIDFGVAPKNVSYKAVVVA